MSTDFEQIKTSALSLPNSQQRLLHQLLGRLLKEDARAQPGGGKPEELLYQCLRHGLQTRQHVIFPKTLATFDKIDRKTSYKLPAVAQELELSLENLFPQCSFLERAGLRTFFVHLAISKIEDDERPLTAIRVLDTLVPLQQLIENRFPDYLASGILQQMILQHVIHPKGARSVWNKSHPQTGA